MPLPRFCEELVHLGLAAARQVAGRLTLLLLRGQTNFARMIRRFDKVYNAERQLADHGRPVRYELPLPTTGRSACATARACTCTARTRPPPQAEAAQARAMAASIAAPGSRTAGPCPGAISAGSSSRSARAEAASCALSHVAIVASGKRQ